MWPTGVHRVVGAAHRANLSDLYFMQRQDRYAKFTGVPTLADYFANLATAVGQMSFAWRDGKLVDPAIGVNPIERSRAFKAAAR